MNEETLLQKLLEEFPKLAIVLEDGPGYPTIFVDDREYAQVAWDMSYRPLDAISKMIRKRGLTKGSVAVRRASSEALYYTYYLYEPTGKKLVHE